MIGSKKNYLRNRKGGAPKMKTSWTPWLADLITYGQKYKKTKHEMER